MIKYRRIVLLNMNYPQINNIQKYNINCHNMIHILEIPSNSYYLLFYIIQLFMIITVIVMIYKY